MIIILTRYQNFDENTEWDMRIHHDYLVEHLGFAGWIQVCINNNNNHSSNNSNNNNNKAGLWKSGGLTAHKHRAPDLHKVHNNNNI